MERETVEIKTTEKTIMALLNEINYCAMMIEHGTGEILACNDKASEYMNIEPEAVCGLTCADLIFVNDEICEVCRVKTGHGPLRCEAGNVFKHVEDSFTLDNGRKVCLLFFKPVDMSESIQIEKLFWNEKFSLPNDLALEKEIMQLKNLDSTYLICFDISSLRKINDIYGRRVGDLLLFAIRDWILEQELQGAHLFRLESDEFCILLNHIDQEQGIRYANHIMKRFQEPWHINQKEEGYQIFCEISMGLIPGVEVGKLEEVLSIIERILKTASERNELVIYSQKYNELTRQATNLEVSLKTCVKNGMQGFAVYYQPIVNSATGQWCGAEALCRWNSPTLGQVPPSVFIPCAEQQGLIGEIGEWVLEESIRQFKSWHMDAHEEFFLDVNISPIQLLDVNLDKKIMDILARWEFPSHKLSLEITESTQLNFTNHTLKAIQRLAQQNISVALDDFGTGYSTFNSLRNIPVKVLKTEKAFLDNIEHDDYLRHLLEMMIKLAHAANKKITAEGVENEEQLNILIEHQVDYIQGYLFSPPIPASEFEQKLGNFDMPINYLSAIKYSSIDISAMTNAENPYPLTPTLYRLLLRCLQIFFNERDIDKGLDQILTISAEALEADRHYICMKNESTGTYSCTHEWGHGGYGKIRESMQDMQLEKQMPSMLKMFEKDGIIAGSDISFLPYDIYENLSKRHVKSVVLVPLVRNGEITGFVGMDICKEHRNWLPEELLTLHSLGGIIANVQESLYLRDEIQYQGQVLTSVLNHLDINIFVSDLETDEILFANESLIKNMGLTGSPVGKPCWKVMQRNKDKRCAFCKVDQLQKNGHRLVWDNLNEINGQHYLVYDSTISWENNKKAHMQYTIDISFVKDPELVRQLLENQRLSGWL